MPPHTAPVSGRRSLESVAVLALFGTLAAALFVVLPFVALPGTILKTFILAAGTVLTLALFILARLSRGNIILPPLALIGALWLPALAYVLSAVFSGLPFANVLWGVALEPDTLSFILCATVLGTMGALVVRRTEQLKTFARASAGAFALLVVLQILIILVGQVAPDTIAPSLSLPGSLSDLAFVLGLGVIGALLALRELDLSSRARRFLTITVVGAVVLLAIANVSLVWVLLALVSLGLFVESVMQRKNTLKDADLDGVSLIDEETPTSEDGNRSLVLPLVVLVLSLFFLIGSSLGGALGGALGVSEINVRPSWQATFDVGSKVLTESPIFGSGPSTFGAEWLKYRDASLNATVFWNVDFNAGIGFIPTSFVTTGLVGAVAWILFFAVFMGIGLRVLLRRMPTDATARYMAMLSFVGTVYFFAIATFHLPSQLGVALLFVFAGLFASTVRFAAQGEQWGVIFSRSPRLGFLIVFSLTILLLCSVIVAYALIGRFIATNELSSANVSLAERDLDATADALERSLAFAPSAVAYQMSATVARERLNDILVSTTLSATEAQTAFQETISAGITAALAASTLAPGDYRSWLVLGNLYAQAVPLNVEGAYENAKAAYDKARELSPTNPQILFTLAQLAIAQEDLKSAEEYVKEAITLKQDYPAAIFLLSQIQVEQGNVDEALASSLAAAYFSPQNANVLFQVGVLYAAKNDFANAELALRAAVDANTNFANARYFLSAVRVKRGDMKGALEEMRAIAALSLENAEAVKEQLAALEAGKNPFPANLLSITPAPVQ